MNAMKDIRYDDYEFFTGDLDAMCAELELIDSETHWVELADAQNLRVSDFQKIDLYAEDPSKPKLHAILQSLDMDQVVDTADEGTQLLISYGDDVHFLLRECAIPSIYQCCGLNGTSLGKMREAKKLDVYAQTLNNGFEVSKGSVKAIIRAGKCSAVRSGKYVIIDTKKVFDVGMEKIRERMGELQFLEGRATHEYVSMSFALPDAQGQFLNLYADALKDSAGAFRGLNFMPMVRICTSDIGNSAAAIYPMVKRQGGKAETMSFCEPLRVEHRGSKNGQEAGLTAFAENAENIYAQFNKSIEMITKMAQTTIYNPINAIRALCKRVNIPDKYTSVAVSSHLAFGEGQCSMHDVYLSIYDGIAGVENPNTKLDLEEKVVRILKLNWKDFDLSFAV